MNSSKIFDDVIQYLEKNIYEGCEIDYNEISKIAMSPAALFQRIFIFVSGVSIADYVRKRKLTLAGYDLKNSGISVLDAAIKYGFHSHSAFSRAFKEHHGITPSEAKLEAARLNNYLPINYSEMRFIGGKRIMAEMKKIVYKEAGERLMVGMYRETSFSEAGAVWRGFFESNAAEKLDRLAEVKCCEDIDSNAGIGMMYNFKDMNHFEFIIGDFVQVGTEIPDGLFAKYVPGGFTAHVQIEGSNAAEILASAYLLITEAIEKTGREIDHDHFYWCEVYTDERYCEPFNRGEKVIIDYVLPIKADSI
ncbi:AraC family transcriptional regulator [Anaerotaenia torta]|uniref:helix-turn-helix domain-containing protein n=1 Tax=Anaerotaenia torta TaxID=433293 RepID=UPI003D20851F